MLQQVMNGKPTAQEVDKAYRAVRVKSAGDIITHGDLETLWGVQRHEHRYRTLVLALRKRMLREQQVSLLSERGVGYRYPTGFEQVRSGVRTIRNGVKRIGKGTTVTMIVSDARLPDAKERGSRDFVVQQAKLLHTLAMTQRRTLELTVGKPEVNPQAEST